MSRQEKLPLNPTPSVIVMVTGWAPSTNARGGRRTKALVVSVRPLATGSGLTGITTEPVSAPLILIA
jgi:hypothetical protein